MENLKKYTLVVGIDETTDVESYDWIMIPKNSNEENYWALSV